MREIDQGNGWRIREILDSTSLKRYTQYFYKRRRAPRIELHDKISQQLAAYTLIEKDLRSVLAWLTEIDKLDPYEKSKSNVSGDREIFNVIKGLYVASLTFYGKCFTSCEGRKVKLDKNIIDEQFIKTHSSIMHMRHNFAAHSGADTFEDVKVALVLYPNKKSDEKPFIYTELMQPDHMDESEDGIKFKDLVNHVREKVIRKIATIRERIYDKEVFPKGKDYWYKKS